MKLKRAFLAIIGVGVIGLILTFAALYIRRPTLVHSIFWHSEKAVQAVYMHNIKKMDIPLISQTKNLNCEAATAAMVLRYYGKQSDIDIIQNSLPLDPNPNKGFRGNVDGNIWGFDDYGVYAAPIANVMTKFGLPSTAYTNISTDFLKQKILAGKPAIIWVDISNPYPQTRVENIHGEKITLVSGEHVAVVTGYENGTWILNDPWRTTKDGVRTGQVLYVDDLDSIHWNDFNHMAVIVN